MIGFFKKHANNLSPQQHEFINASFKKEVFKKNEHLFMGGEQNTKHYIIEEGLLRLYVINANGKEFNVLFAKENQIIGDLSTPNPTSFFLAAVERTVAYSITEEKLQQLSDALDIVFGADSSSYLRKSYIFLQSRLVAILTQSAEENYLKFRDQNPDLVQRLPQYHIAAYLGVSAEFLSKIIAKSTKRADIKSSKSVG